MGASLPCIPCSLLSNHDSISPFFRISPFIALIFYFSSRCLNKKTLTSQHQWQALNYSRIRFPPEMALEIQRPKILKCCTFPEFSGGLVYYSHIYDIRRWVSVLKRRLIMTILQSVTGWLRKVELQYVEYCTGQFWVHERRCNLFKMTGFLKL